MAYNTSMTTNYPLEYKMIPVQFCFSISETKDGAIVKARAVSELPKEKVYKTVAEARKAIEELEELL